IPSLISFTPMVAALASARARVTGTQMAKPAARPTRAEARGHVLRIAPMLSGLPRCRRSSPDGGKTPPMHAAWWMLGALAVLAIGYRYYSGFLAAKVLCLDDARVTAAHALEDGENFHPTNRWVLFGHHFAAITGAGPP